MVAPARSVSDDDEDAQPLFQGYPTLNQNSLNRSIAPERRQIPSHSQTVVPLLNLTIPTPQPSPLPANGEDRPQDPAAGLGQDSSLNKRNSLGLELDKRLSVVERRRSRTGMEQDKEKGFSPDDGGVPRLNSILLGGSGPNAPSAYRPKKKRLSALYTEDSDPLGSGQSSIGTTSAAGSMQNLQTSPISSQSGSLLPPSTSTPLRTSGSSRLAASSPHRHSSANPTTPSSIRVPAPSHQRSTSRTSFRPPSRSTFRSHSNGHSMDGGRPASPSASSQLSIPISAIITPRITSVHPEPLSFHMKDPELTRKVPYTPMRRASSYTPSSVTTKVRTPVNHRDRWTFREALGVFQVQMFILGFLFPFAWIIGALWRIEEPYFGVGEKGEKTEEWEGYGEAESTWRFARKWRRRCLITGVIGLVLWAIVIALAAVFGHQR